MKLKINIPIHNQQEVKYIFHCLLEVFLGISIRFEVNESNKDYSISCPKGTIHIENHFFTSDDTNTLYDKEHIPSEVISRDYWINEVQLPMLSLYGEPTIVQEGENWTLSTDLIASSFYMLTRWEEYVIKKRDHHSRFCSKDALAVKHNFIDRPIVNEYVEVLWQLIKACGYQGSRLQRAYKLVPTHDVDFPYKWNGISSKIRTLAGRMIKGDLVGFYKYLSFVFRGEDPYDTYDLLMDRSEEKGTKSYFFFMSGGNSPYDNNYQLENPRIIQLIDKIKRRGHDIGFHPSYNTCTDLSKYREEKQKLEKVSGSTIKTGRQHFLKFEVPSTWSIWDANEMDWDSSMTYADKSGFRCGVCYSFPVFDMRKRKMLNLFEKPLIVMDVSIVEHELINRKEKLNKLEKLKSEVRKYKGEFVFLWHNSSFNEGTWLDRAILREVYK